MVTSTSLERDADPTRDLVERARDGSDAAWEELYVRYHGFLRWTLQVHSPRARWQRADVEDALQNAFLAAWRRIDTFEYRGDGSLRRWLGTIVTRRALDVLRDKGREPHIRSKDSSAADLVLRDDGTPSEELARDEDRTRLYEALARLDEEPRAIVGMRMFEGLTFEAIAGALELPSARVRRWFWEALGKLGDDMGRKRPPLC